MRQNLINVVQAIRDASLSQTIYLPPKPEGRTACYDRLAAVDFTAALTLLTFGFAAGAQEFLIESFANPAQNQVVSTQSRVFVDSGYTPFIRVTGGGAGDRIAFYVYGYVSDNGY